MADNKCTLLRKAVKGTVYYKCKKEKCDKECLIHVLWEDIEGIGDPDWVI